MKIGTIVEIIYLTKEITSKPHKPQRFQTHEIRLPVLDSKHMK
jgi:hypothetical protein